MAALFARDACCTQSKELVARDVMISNPKSIAQDATVREMAGFLSAYGFQIAPVIDEAGRPIGVVSRTDLLGGPSRDCDRLYDLAIGKSTFHSMDAAPTDETSNPTAKDIMTPVVECVSEDTPIATVVEKFLELEIRSLFVSDAQGVLIGLIRIFDLLRTVAEHVTRLESERLIHQCEETKVS